MDVWRIPDAYDADDEDGEHEMSCEDDEDNEDDEDDGEREMSCSDDEDDEDNDDDEEGFHLPIVIIFSDDDEDDDDEEEIHLHIGNDSDEEDYGVDFERGWLSPSGRSL